MFTNLWFTLKNQIENYIASWGIGFIKVEKWNHFMESIGEKDLNVGSERSEYSILQIIIAKV
jgi:hypothetical protein